MFFNLEGSQPSIYFAERKNMLKAILYTDGSARPNPGNAGWGCHGYIFDPEYKTTKPYKTEDGLGITNNGYSDHVKKGEDVTPISFIDAYGSFDKAEYPDETQTNILAEIAAIYEGLKIAFSNGASDITVYSDSSVNINLCSTIDEIHKRNYRKSDGKGSYSHKAILEKIYTLIKSIKDVNGKVTFKWVKGHAGIKGNELADRLALVGMQHTKACNYTDSIKVQETKAYKTPKTDKPDLICLPRIYFSTNPYARKIGEYFMAGYITTKPDQFYLGKKSSDSIYCLVILNKSCKQLEDVIHKHQRMNHMFEKLVRLDTTILFKKDMMAHYNSFGEYSMIQEDKMFGPSEVRGLNNETITIDEVPSCLAYRAIEVCREISEMLGMYKRNEFPEYIKIKDITSCLYMQDGKSLKLKPEYINSNVKIPIDDLDIDLYFRLNMPDRNVMKRLEKKNVKVLYGMYTTEVSIAFDFCIIDCDEGCLVWTNRYARRITDYISKEKL